MSEPSSEMPEKEIDAAKSEDLSKLDKLERYLKNVAILIGAVWAVFYFYETEVPKLWTTAKIVTNINLYDATNAWPYNLTLNTKVTNIGLAEFNVKSMKIVGRRLTAGFGSKPYYNAKRSFDFDEAFTNSEELFSEEVSADSAHSLNGAILDKYPQNQSREADSFYRIMNLRYGDTIFVIVSVSYTTRGFSLETTRAFSELTYSPPKKP
jgi:hypothetical protein